MLHTHKLKFSMQVSINCLPRKLIKLPLCFKFILHVIRINIFNSLLFLRLAEAWVFISEKCPLPPTVPHTIYEKCDHTVGSVCPVHCEVGYTYTLLHKEHPVQGAVVCNAAGRWNMEEFQCKSK